MGLDKNEKERLVKKVNEATVDFHPREYRKHKVHILTGIMDRLEELADECSECSKFHNTFETGLINKLEFFNHANQREYHLNLRDILTHLRKKHKLVTMGYYAELYMALGIALGLPVGAATGNMGIGFIIGMGVGLAIGGGIDFDARKKGNVIV